MKDEMFKLFIDDYNILNTKLNTIILNAFLIFFSSSVNALYCSLNALFKFLSVFAYLKYRIAVSPFSCAFGYKYIMTHFIAHFKKQRGGSKPRPTICLLMIPDFLFLKTLLAALLAYLLSLFGGFVFLFLFFCFQ